MAQCQKPSLYRHPVPSEEALGMFYFLFIGARLKTVRLLTSTLSSLKMMTEVLPTCNGLHGLRMLSLPKPTLKCICWKPITLNRHTSKQADNSTRSPYVQQAGKVQHLTLQEGTRRLRAAGNKHPTPRCFHLGVRAWLGQNIPTSPASYTQGGLERTTHVQAALLSQRLSGPGVRDKSQEHNNGRDSLRPWAAHLQMIKSDKDIRPSCLRLRV